ncbi:AglZ/HisF2 family acetamidino modification protein [Geomonas azotofigens]|uniref:AglZ/HisF2 family acetamidino modification protein n=1 Tax=Geomonas azotofigens TaxID=2843196 RepID=UPI001C124EE7|nr:AglZ/HisF2 family acetamidino modification protein [Geomonas azotofigens]MBU5613377.1 AglZ/HisF2 family acetamidino modification protein [Geomonas azotofigens]
MLRTRVIPCLLLKDESLVKTVKFKNYSYIGDPINTVRIFNELEVDELVFLDIVASRENRPPNFRILEQIANECFMPLAYGGGLCNIDDVGRIFAIGFEKVIVNSQAVADPAFISRLADRFGSQSIVGSVDARKNLWGRYEVFTHGGTRKSGKTAVEWAVELERMGAGELLITSMDREGTWAGYDVNLTEGVAAAVKIPVIANGGAGSVAHLGEVVKRGNASAVAVGSMVVFQGKDLGVLVNFPDKRDLKEALL